VCFLPLDRRRAWSALHRHDLPTLGGTCTALACAARATTYSLETVTLAANIGRLATARLDLEPLTVAAAAEMVTVLADPSLYRHTGGVPPDLPTLTERYRRQAAGSSPDGSERWLNWIVRPRVSREAVGYVQATIRPATGEANVAWVVGTAFQGHRYATEASHAVVDWLVSLDATKRVTAHIGADNVASQAVARRLGFVPTAEVSDGETVWELRS
jgi:RimJ/RimL family protein N-acetyltransferase